MIEIPSNAIKEERRGLKDISCGLLTSFRQKSGTYRHVWAMYEQFIITINLETIYSKETMTGIWKFL